MLLFHNKFTFALRQSCLALGFADHHTARRCDLIHQRQQPLHRAVVIRRVHKHKIILHAAARQKGIGFAPVNIALCGQICRTAVGGDHTNGCIAAIHDGGAQRTARNCFNAQLPAAAKQIQHFCARQKKLYAAEHGLLHPIHGGAGHIFSRQSL